jgi:hypothetical protein
MGFPFRTDGGSEVKLGLRQAQKAIRKQEAQITQITSTLKA